MALPASGLAARSRRRWLRPALAALGLAALVALLGLVALPRYLEAQAPDRSIRRVQEYRPQSFHGDATLGRLIEEQAVLAAQRDQAGSAQWQARWQASRAGDGWLVEVHPQRDVVVSTESWGRWWVAADGQLVENADERALTWTPELPAFGGLVARLAPSATAAALGTPAPAATAVLPAVGVLVTAFPTSLPAAPVLAAHPLQTADASPAGSATTSPASETLEPAATGTPTAQPTQVMLAFSEGAGVYMHPTKRLADRSKAYAEGTLLTVLGPVEQADGKDWLHVRAPDGKEGWVVADYTAPPGSVTPVVAARAAQPAAQPASQPQQPGGVKTPIQPRPTATPG